MAKISAKQRAENKEKFDQIVEEVFWDYGWDGVTLNSVANRAGVRKSTIQNYYPSKIDFGLALKGKSFPVVMEALDLTNPEEFKISWEVALKTNKRFRMVVHLLVSNATSDTTSEMTISGIVRLRNLLADKWQGDKIANDTLMWVLGLSVVKLAET